MIPLLIAGAVALAGVGAHANAKEKNEQAESKLVAAKKLYDDSNTSLTVAKTRAEKVALNLGYKKKEILNTSLKQFIECYEKIADIDVGKTDAMIDLSRFKIEKQDVLEIKEMVDIYSSSTKSATQGMGVGVITGLALNGSLSLVASMASMGVSMGMGIGTSASIAGSALATGIAATPFSLIAAPVVLFTGLSATMKADENLDEARATYAKAREASEKMKVQEVLCKAIEDQSTLFYNLINELNSMFSESSALFAGLIKKKELLGKTSKKLSREDLTKDEEELIAKTGALASAVKTVIAAPILSDNGNISEETQELYVETKDNMPALVDEFDRIKKLAVNVDPVYIKSTVKVEDNERKELNIGVFAGIVQFFKRILVFFMRFCSIVLVIFALLLFIGGMLWGAIIVFIIAAVIYAKSGDISE